MAFWSQVKASLPSMWTTVLESKRMALQEAWNPRVHYKSAIAHSHVCLDCSTWPRKELQEFCAVHICALILLVALCKGPLSERFLGIVTISFVNPISFFWRSHHLRPRKNWHLRPQDLHFTGQNRHLSTQTGTKKKTKDYQFLKAGFQPGCGHIPATCQERKSSLNINFLGGIFLGHPGPRRRDIPDKNFMQVAFFCCFRQGVAGMSRDLGRDVPGFWKKKTSCKKTLGWFFTCHLSHPPPLKNSLPTWKIYFWIGFGLLPEKPGALTEINFCRFIFGVW